MGGVIDALRALDVSVDDQGRGTLPFTLQGNGSVTGGEVTLDASASSQFVSALLLAAPRFDKGLTVRHRGAPVPSLPHIEMTVAMLRDRGVVVDVNDDDASNASWTVHPGPIAGRDEAVEPDLSNAAPFLAAAMIAGGTITVPGWPSATTQPGDDLRVLLTSMGARTTLDETGLHLDGPGRDGIIGLDADLRDVGELTPSIAALCVLANTPSRLTGIAHLRGHETDRLAALATEINRLGGNVTEESDGLSIVPAPLHGGRVETYDDHRMATAGAVIGLAVPGVQIENIATTAKTMPGFTDMWARLLGGA
jgi:3-phosphoshikimate 1-carboxyvinyltransferase